MFKVEITSPFDEFWRYNIQLMCVGYNHAGEQIFVESTQDLVAQVGEGMERKPKGYPENRTVAMELSSAASIRLLIYLVPHILPKSQAISDAPPFDIDVEVSQRGGLIYSEIHKINQWAGASLNIEI